jgi:hypothetical protein
LLGANTSQAAEGTVGSPISESTTKILATIGLNKYWPMLNLAKSVDLFIIPSTL